MRDLIKKILQEELEKKHVIVEMSKTKTYCEKHFSSPELEFCTASESYIKSEIENVDGYKKKVIFNKFNEGLSKFYKNLKSEILHIKIEELTDFSEIVSDGKNEMGRVIEYLKNNCLNIEKVANKQLKKLKDETKLYFTGEKGEYNITNRLNTNYTAIAVLFTKFFSKKGAFDGVNPYNDFNWVEISRNWINHSFDPSIKFEDIRPEEEQNNKSAELSSLEFQEMLKIYFTNSISFNSSDIRGAVEEVLKDIRERGFDSENKFEKLLTKGGRKFIRYAKDFGFVDMYLGIDFIYKGNNFWIPVQVKSSKKEVNYLIDSLGCRSYVVAHPEQDKWKIESLPKDEILPN